MAQTSEKETIRAMSDQLVELQRPIRILNAVAWGDEIKAEFFARGATEQPKVDAAYYAEHRPLGYDPAALREALAGHAVTIRKQLGEEPVADLMCRRLADYEGVIAMLEARGTAAFSELSVGLYGGVADQLHVDGPTLASLGEVMTEALTNIDSGTWDPPESREHSAEDAVQILQDRLDSLCGAEQVRIKLDDGIVADAAAGSTYIKLREGAEFSDRDLRVLEVHEGWVHVATGLNGRDQSICTFLSKGTPATTVTQEGLAVFTEITTMSSTPERLRTIARRIRGIAMADDGATFLDVFRWLLTEGLDDDDAWAATVRVFRGSTPTEGPFTKDLVYSQGFLEVYDTVRLVVRHGMLDRIPLMFVGKISVHELGTLAQLAEQGLIEPPAILPPHVRDVSALASWMAFSNLLNRIDLDTMEQHLADALGR